MSKKNALSTSTAFLFLLLAGLSWAGGTQLNYRFTEDDQWKMIDRSESTTEMMGTKFSSRSKRVTLYKVTQNLGKGWYRIAAQVASQKNWDSSGQSNEQNSFAGMRFTADVHKSGVVRNYRFTGGDPQLAKMIGPAMKPAIFFFPEFPDEALEPGDDFDSIIRYEMPGMMGAGGMKTVMKMTYTLEDINDGMATFSVKQRMKMRGSGMDIKSGGKSESVFDLNEGMWVEYETNTKSTTGSGLASGGSTLTRSKVTVEKK